MLSARQIITTNVNTDMYNHLAQMLTRAIKIILSSGDIIWLDEYFNIIVELVDNIYVNIWLYENFIVSSDNN
jgi:hypothetical protein